MSVSTPPRGTALFVVSQIVFLALAAIAWRWVADDPTGNIALPGLRAQPLELRPLWDDPTVVSNDQLRRVLSRLGLRFAGKETRIANVDHSLRLWGQEGVPPGEGAMTGAEMMKLLTDNRRFVEVYGRQSPPLLLDAGAGVRVRAFEGTTSSSHIDHTMAALAEVGAPLTYPVTTPSGVKSFRALVEQSLRDFSLNQPEYEWSALTYALLVTRPSWTSSEGQQLSFGKIADRIMREGLDNGVCSANHRMHALVGLLAADRAARDVGDGEETGLLEGESRQKVLDFLREVTALFVHHQDPAGYWNDHWPTRAPSDDDFVGREVDELADRLIVTGHVLEWWALSPEELQPPRPVVVAAAQWLVATIDHLSEAEIERHYSYLSHAGRALALWRGRFAFEVDVKG